MAVCRRCRGYVMTHATKVISGIPMISGYVFLCMGRAELRREERMAHCELLRDAGQEETFIRELNILRRCEPLAREEPIAVNPDIVRDSEALAASSLLSGPKTTVISRDDEHEAIILKLTILNRHVEYPAPAEILKKITG